VDPTSASGSALRDVVEMLDRWRRRTAGDGPWLVAFSGGGDSTALALGLARSEAARETITLVHVDHGLDGGSQVRAAEAGRIAAAIGLPFRLERLEAADRRNRGESPETFARRLRYDRLERVRVELGARAILTAHHRDDQIETLLLQMLRGVALERCGGIAERRGAIHRPLLPLSRARLAAVAADAGLRPIVDPTNFELDRPRNRMRHQVLPALLGREPELAATLLELGCRVRALRERLGARFAPALGGDATPPLEALRRLPAALRPAALRWFLAERHGLRDLPSARSIDEFLRQLQVSESASIAVPGGDLRLRAAGGRLRLATAKSRTPPFSYTFRMPGEVELPELGLRLRIRRSPVEPWMFQGDRARVGFAADAGLATVRNRRPGDRLVPLGAPGSRKLKALLIDRGIPADNRDRLPLLEIGGELAWVPGVTLGERFALRGGRECWLATLERLDGAEAFSSTDGERKTTT